MRYRTIRCPNCKQFIEFRKPQSFSYNEFLGNPIAFCPKCSKPYKTNLKKWNNMTIHERNVVKQRTYLVAFAWAFLFTFIGMIVYSFLDEKFNFTIGVN